jgi:stress-induced morphogen
LLLRFLNLDLLKPQNSQNSKLQAALAPVSLSVANESHLHAGHSGNPSGAPDAETHFRVEAVSEEFEGKNPVARHRLVYGALGSELKEGLHALALKTRTPREAQAAAEAKEAAK